jgi:hypothetical protein
MKKLIVTISAMAMAIGAFAQGYVTLGNGSGLLEDTNNILSPFFGGPGGGNQGSATGATAVSASALYYTELLTAPYSGTLTANTNVMGGAWLDTGLITQNGVSGQPGKILQLAGVLANNWGIGSTQQFILAAWSANLGSSWGNVSNLLNLAMNGNNTPLLAQLAGATGFFGVSAVSFAAAAAPPTAAPSILWTTAGPQSYGNPIASGIGLYLLPSSSVVPEPATMALVGLGGLSLLLFRRQRK